MGHAQLLGRFLRLKQELAVAYRTQPWHGAKIDRIADELVVAERQLAALGPQDEQCDESMLPFAI